MSIPAYQVDAFAERPFTGNPPGVCVLEKSTDKIWMQPVAMEMNLSETAFVRCLEDGDFDLRWFTPVVEVDLCGHAALATSHILWETGVLKPHELARYHVLGGLLQAQQADGLIELDFPATPPGNCEPQERLVKALGLDWAVYVGRTRFDYLVEVDSGDVVKRLTPDFAALRLLGVRGVMVAAKSENDELDFVSRFFAPRRRHPREEGNSAARWRAIELSWLARRSQSCAES